MGGLLRLWSLENQPQLPISWPLWFLPKAFADALVTSRTTPFPTGAHGLSWLCLQLTTLGICQDVSHFILGLHLFLWARGFGANVGRDVFPGCCASYMHQTRNVWYIYLHLLNSFGKYTLPETNIVPENRSLEKGDSYWTIGNHHLFVSGRLGKNTKCWDGWVAPFEKACDRHDITMF